jgi:hypothetical protein
MRRRFMILLATCTLGACAAPRTVSYDLPTLPNAWRPVKGEHAHHLFHHEKGGAIIANSSCRVSDSDAPLDVLTNHLLFELQDVKERGRRRLVLAGRAALRTSVDATLDGVPIALELVVLKKDGCTVDLHLVTSPEQRDARRADFDRFLERFTMKDKGG